MARIRTLKPEFFTSADIVSLTAFARLFYQALWCESDREGKLKWNLKTLKLRYFPGDECDLPARAVELKEQGNLVLYEVNGESLAFLPNFSRHQSINNKEAQSVLPDPPGPPGRKGKEGKGKEVACKTRVPRVFHASGMNPEIFEKYLEMRRRIRKPATETAIQLALGVLDRLKNQGHDPNAVLEQSILNSWQGLFELKGKQGSRAKPLSTFEASIQPEDSDAQ